MTDEDLIRSFEAGVEPDSGFHHAEHVRVAWWYVRHHPLDAALGRFRAGLRHFAEAHGMPQRYHETITTAYVLLIADRVDANPGEHSWEAFARRHSDLLSWKPSILDRCYTPERLWSEAARATFLLPDRDERLARRWRAVRASGEASTRS